MKSPIKLLLFFSLLMKVFFIVVFSISLSYLDTVLFRLQRMMTSCFPLDFNFMCWSIFETLLHPPLPLIPFLKSSTHRYIQPPFLPGVTWVSICFFFCILLETLYHKLNTRSLGFTLLPTIITTNFAGYIIIHALALFTHSLTGLSQF